ncbi:SDR family NAD(P)-dependent oxidoreductase [Umezawaea sp. NPDC059074]|uniref:SDR family NAD(P)-dependent oxidoreductase n=1 Tax=Umezawaea sp. NPDC059074 TaxID=3346716 RepID=UPI0036808F0B
MTAAIAVVGMACRYADATGVDELWQTVLGRRKGFRSLPEGRLGAAYRGEQADQTYVSHAGLLRGWEFDRAAFGVPGPLYRAVDQTHWLALQTCAEALADAGHPDAEGLDRDRVGVVLGNSLTGEFSRAATLRLRWPFIHRAALAAMAASGLSPQDADLVATAMRDLVRAPFPEPGDESLAGALANTIAGRVCNHFDFHGTGYTVDGACASSLLAVMAACRALASHELDFALAGGVDLSLDPFELVGFARMGAVARGASMRVYDSRPTGFLPGEGCGVVGLMRADDALRAGHRVYATIAGWGTASDGAGGLTRPEQAGQTKALRRAYEMARLDPVAAGYFEGHGTGTEVGDRVELLTLTSVRATAAKPAALGSVKANIGHTKAAAGVAGLIKAALAVHHRVLPPTTGCDEPHGLLRGNRSVRVLDEPEEWTGPQVVAGVSAMGFGGVNTHVVLAGGEPRASTGVPVRRPLPRHEIVPLSAVDPDDLGRQLAELEALAPSLSQAELHDLAATEHRRGLGGAVRCALVASGPEQLTTAATRARAALSTWDGTPLAPRDADFVLAHGGPHRIGLLFPGQAAPVRARLDDWATDVPALPPGVVVNDGDTDTAVAQPAIVRQSLAALGWLESTGVEFACATGHSLGEIAALVWAGALTATDGLALAADRGAIMARHGRRGTTMASVALPPEQVRELLSGIPVTVAGHNGPANTAIAGDSGDVRVAVARAKDRGAAATLLPVSHGFHSEAMRHAVAPLTDRLAHTRFRPPSRTVYSTVTGAELGGEDPAALLARQPTLPVRFTDALAHLRCDLLVEAGPGTTLASLVTTPVVSVDCGGDGRGHALTTAALACVGGMSLDPWFADRPYRRFDRDTRMTMLTNPCEQDLTAPRPEETAPEEHEDRGDPDPVAVLREHLSHSLELPAASVRPDSLLLGDLHLNSLQVVQVVVDVADRLGRRVPPLAVSTAESTVEEIAALCASQPPVDAHTDDVGVRPWVRAFEHRWVPWTPRATPCRWTVRAPEDDWVHAVARQSAVEDSAVGGLAVRLDDAAGAEDISALLREISARTPDVLTIVHHGHPAASAIARAVGAEIDGCRVAAVEIAPGDRLPVLPVGGGTVRVRDGRAEQLATSVRVLRGADIPLEAGEVCLVTGGADGITARCAAALAERTGCTLVLVGRSEPDSERVREGLRALPGAHYLAGDVTDPDQVRAIVAAAGAHGPVRGLLHGAGVNAPRPLGDVTATSLADTTAPKATALRALLDEIDDPRLVVGFGSVIGRIGLHGQSEYCVANELMRAELEAWAVAHPRCRARLLEWSAWSDVGMAHRMGVLSPLRDRGVAPIDPEEGTAALLAAVGDPDAPVTLLVTGRFPATPVVRFATPEPDPLRFSADVVTWTPGVEVVLDPVISTGTDPYLEDHRIDGVAVLPAVVGLEAAAQAAAAVVGERDGWTFTDVELATPITVDDRDARPLRIAALADTGGSVEVVVRGTADHLTAAVTPAGPVDLSSAEPTSPPRRDEPHPFYGPLFFHTGELRALLDYEKLTAFEVRAWIRTNPRDWFSGYHSSRLLLGDIAAHDATIHVLLACLPHRTALPVAVERITVWRRPEGDLLVTAREREHTDDEYVFDVALRDRSGAPVARWDGLRLKAIAARRWPGPLPARLVGPWLSRRLGECGIAARAEFASDADRLTGDAPVVWSTTPKPAHGKLATTIARKTDEPLSVSATRVACARQAVGDVPLTVDEVVDDVLVVLGTPTARVVTARFHTGGPHPVVVAVVI